MYNLYHFKPLAGFSLDSRSLKENDGYIALKGRYHDGHEFIDEAIRKGASLVIAQKDTACKFKVPFFIVDDTYRALATVAAYIRKKKNPYIYAIAGSVGKTTTKEMLSFLLEGNCKVLKSYKTENNILGISKTLFALGDEKIVVMELGTNAFGEMEALAKIVYPDVGIITFIKPVHLEGLKTMKGIFEEKTSLLKINPAIKAILNKDDPYLRRINFCKKTYW
jgi:UDP-N-acetylmuramyl pentapeptide synthase